MSRTLTIARRELASLFFSPIAYVVLGLFAIGSGLIFLLHFGSGQPASLRGTLDGVAWLMIFLVPAVSMRLLSEELRAGTIESLMTTPVSDAEVVVGKWLGAMGFLVALLIPLIAQYGVLEYYGDPDPGPVVSGLVGLLLVGALYLAIGTLASASTQNQIIAFLLTVFIISMITFLTLYLPRASFVSRELADAMYYLNVNLQFQDFTKGLIDTSNLMFFVSGSALFLFLAVKLLESRRWR